MLPETPRRLAKPVAWLFGPDLIASLKAVILHTLYRGFDVRDWMRAEVLVSPESKLGKTAYVLLAGGIGFFCGCFHFAWYLAVSHLFHGHNNEVGGASRIGSFKQFLRIRVEPERLTVHAIAVDRPGADAERLSARLVDVFTVAPSAAPPAPPVKATGG